MKDEFVENQYAQTLNAILDSLPGMMDDRYREQIGNAINVTFSIVESFKKNQTSHESKALTKESLRNMLRNLTGSHGGPLDLALVDDMTIAVEAIHAALPSETAKDQRIRELETELGNEVSESSNLHIEYLLQARIVKTQSETIAAMQRQIDELKSELDHAGITRDTQLCAQETDFIQERNALKRQIDDLQAEVMQIPDSTARELDLEKLIIEMQEIIDKQERQINDWREALLDISEWKHPCAHDAMKALTKYPKA